MGIWTRRPKERVYGQFWVEKACKELLWQGVWGNDSVGWLGFGRLAGCIHTV
jgi:hypothetical protein